MAAVDQGRSHRNCAQLALPALLLLLAGTLRADELVDYHRERVLACLGRPALARDALQELSRAHSQVGMWPESVAFYRELLTRCTDASLRESVENLLHQALYAKHQHLAFAKPEEGAHAQHALVALRRALVRLAPKPVGTAVLSVRNVMSQAAPLSVSSRARGSAAPLACSAMRSRLSPLASKGRGLVAKNARLTTSRLTAEVSPVRAGKGGLQLSAAAPIHPHMTKAKTSRAPTTGKGLRQSVARIGTAALASKGAPVQVPRSALKVVLAAPTAEGVTSACPLPQVAAPMPHVKLSALRPGVPALSDTGVLAQPVKELRPANVSVRSATGFAPETRRLHPEGGLACNTPVVLAAARPRSTSSPLHTSGTKALAVGARPIAQTHASTSAVEVTNSSGPPLRPVAGILSAPARPRCLLSSLPDTVERRPRVQAQALAIASTASRTQPVGVLPHAARTRDPLPAPVVMEFDGLAALQRAQRALALRWEAMGLPVDRKAEMDLRLSLLGSPASKSTVLSLAGTALGLYLEDRDEQEKHYREFIAVARHACHQSNLPWLILATAQAAYEAEARGAVHALLSEIPEDGRDAEIDRATRLLQALSHLSVSHHAQGRAALDEWLKLYAGSDAEEKVRFLMGWSYLVEGKKKDALFWFQDVVKRHPDGEYATRATAFVKRLRPIVADTSPPPTKKKEVF